MLTVICSERIRPTPLPAGDPVLANAGPPASNEPALSEGAPAAAAASCAQTHAVVIERRTNRDHLP